MKLSDMPTCDLQYDLKNSEESAKHIVTTLLQEWKDASIRIKPFSEGLTNTMLHIKNEQPNASKDEIQKSGIVLRAFGQQTETLVDREREIRSHLVLTSHGLAPEILGRFKNGFLYDFTPGDPCETENLSQERTWRAVARTMGRWHAVLPTSSDSSGHDKQNLGHADSSSDKPAHIDKEGTEEAKKLPSKGEIDQITPDASTPNIWTNMRKWTLAMPEGNEKEKKLKREMSRNVEMAYERLGKIGGFDGKQHFVMGHCDLLAGNILVNAPVEGGAASPPGDRNSTTASFIDYEFCCLAPPAFDIAMHFNEWPGIEVDYSRLPSLQTRRAFVEEYLTSYHNHWPDTDKTIDEDEYEKQVDTLMAQIDQFRGLPGLWVNWWALDVQSREDDEDTEVYRQRGLAEFDVFLGLDELKSHVTKEEWIKAAQDREEKWFHSK